MLIFGECGFVHPARVVQKVEPIKFWQVTSQIQNTVAIAAKIISDIGPYDDTRKAA